MTYGIKSPTVGERLAAKMSRTYSVYTVAELRLDGFHNVKVPAIEQALAKLVRGGRVRRIKYPPATGTHCARVAYQRIRSAPAPDSAPKSR